MLHETIKSSRPFNASCSKPTQPLVEVAGLGILVEEDVCVLAEAVDFAQHLCPTPFEAATNILIVIENLIELPRRAQIRGMFPYIGS